MKNLLVLGDSFMSPDRWRSKYAGTHWTEKCRKYNIRNLAKPGYSNYNIIRLLHLALEKKLDFDYVLLWFTDHRLTFPNLSDQKWLGTTITNCSPEYLTADQTIAAKYYFTEIPEQFMLEQTALEILGTLSWLKTKQLKFLFNFGQWHGFPYLPYGESLYNELLEWKESKYNFSEIDISHYTANNKLIIDSKSGPSYHTKEFWQDHIVSAVEKKFQEVYGE